MAFKMRSTKFRHVYGSPFRKEHCFENVRITRNAHDSNFCAVNPKQIAVVTESAGGGSFLVLPVDRPGRVDINSPKVCGHSGAIMDVKWSPFNDDVIASCSDDSSIKVWNIPSEGLYSNLTDWLVDLHGHTRKVTILDWHPTTENILLSVGLDYKCIVWNVEQAEPVNILDCHNDTIFSISWNNDGSLFSTTSKDKRLRILDPRMGNVALDTEGFPGTKSSKCVFIRDNQQIFTTGFSRTSERLYALWDVRRITKPLVQNVIDYDSSVLLPYYDPDLNIVYLAGKGNGNIRYYEIANEEPYVHFLNAYQSSAPQRSLGIMPKRGCDVSKCEVFRFYKMHAAKNLIEPISMICPRKSDKFQEDIYPPTHGIIPSLSPDEWIAGQNRDPILVSVADGHVLNTPQMTTSKAVQKQESALNLAPTITTYKAVNNQNLENKRSAPRRANTIASETITHNNYNEPASIRNIKRLSTNEDFVSIRAADSQRIQQSQTPRTGAKFNKSAPIQGTDYVRPSASNLDVIPSDSEDNFPETLLDQDISTWQENTLSDTELSLEDFDLQYYEPVYTQGSNYFYPATSSRSYQQQPEPQPQKHTESEPEDFKSPFMKIKESVKRNLEVKPTEVPSTSIYDKERERIRPMGRSSSQDGIKKRFYDSDRDITKWQEETLNRHKVKGLPPKVNSSKHIENSLLRSLKKQAQLRRKGDVENYDPEEELNPSFNQAKRYVQKQTTGESTRPKSMVDMDTSKLEQDLAAFQQARSVQKPAGLVRQKSLEKEKDTYMSDPSPYSQPKRPTERPSFGIYRQNSLEKEDNRLIQELQVSPFSRRIEPPPSPEEIRKRPPKASSSSPFSKRREFRTAEIPSPIDEKVDITALTTNRPSYPKIKQETIVTARPFMPFDVQTPTDKRREYSYPQPPRVSEKVSQPVPLYRQNSLEKQEEEDFQPNFFQAKRNFETSQEESPNTPTQKLSKGGSLSPFAKRREIRSSELPNKEKIEVGSSYSANRASYPQGNTDNVSARPFVPYEAQTSPDVRRNSYDKQQPRRMFEFPSSNQEPRYGSHPTMFYRKDQFSPQVYTQPGSPYFQDNQRDSFVKKDRSRGFDYQPVQKVEPYQPFSETRGSTEKYDVNYRPKDVSCSPTPDIHNNRASFPPVSSKRFEPVVNPTYENDVDIAAWEEEALRHYDARPPRPTQTQKRTTFDRRSGSISPKVFLKEKIPPPPPSPTSKSEDSQLDIPHSGKLINQIALLMNKDDSLRVKEEQLRERLERSPSNSSLKESNLRKNSNSLTDIRACPIVKTNEPRRKSEDLFRDVHFVKNGDSGKLRLVKVDQKKSSTTILTPDHYFIPLPEYEEEEGDEDVESLTETINNDSEVTDFTERKALFENKTPSPLESPSTRVEKRVWSPTSPVYKEPPSTNGISVSDSDKEHSHVIVSSKAVFRPSNGTTDTKQGSPRKRRPYSELYTSGFTNVSLTKLVLGEPTTQPTHKIHVRKMWQQPPSKSGADEHIGHVPNTDVELKKAYFRQQDEIRQLQEQINLKDKRIRQLEEELRGIRETSCGPGENLFNLRRQERQARFLDG